MQRCGNTVARTACAVDLLTGQSPNLLVPYPCRPPQLHPGLPVGLPGACSVGVPRPAVSGSIRGARLVHHVLGGLHPSHALTVDPWASSSVRRALVCRCAWCTSMCRFSAGTVEDPRTPQPHSSPLAALGPLSLTLGPLSFPHGCLGRHLQRTGSEHTWLCELVLSLNTALSRNLCVGCGPYDVDFPECCSLCSRSSLDSASDVVYPPY